MDETTNEHVIYCQDTDMSDMMLRDKIREKGAVPESLLHLVPNRYEVIGDVAVIVIPYQLQKYKHVIAKTITEQRKNIRTVLNKVAMLDGDARVGGYEILYGSETITLHREYGHRYRMDVRTVFFNTHLAYERFRIASKVRHDEHVLVPFSGVGPFVIPAAVRGARVTAVDSNPMACQWLADNVRLNHVEEYISVILGDAQSIPRMLKPGYDRAIIPAPYGMDPFLWDVAGMVKKGGIIHSYTFKKSHEIPGLVEEYGQNDLEVEFHRQCGNVAPGVSRWVFDLIKH
ncbi:MAG: RsmD family RNA methyltransferase [ANME-2 cluster archaeon]|nr:RsmD family RNA methyltransferase [ANME-2 cluster archaeon]